MTTGLPHFHRPPKPLTVAVTQFACGWDLPANIARAEAMVRDAARAGAQVILLPELFETPYFCIEQDTRHLRPATTLQDNIAVQHFAQSVSISSFDHDSNNARCRPHVDHVAGGVPA